MSKKNAVLAKVEEIANRHGAGYLVEAIKAEIASVWGESASEEETAPPAPETETFNVLVGVEVLKSARAYQNAVERAVEEALTQAATSRDEVVSLSVTSAF